MSKLAVEQVIGVVVRDDVLTMVRREDHNLAPDGVIECRVNGSLDAAATILSRLATTHAPVNVYIESDGAGPATLAEIRRHVDQSGDAVHFFYGESLATKSYATEAGATFRDRGSELIYRFREKVEAGALAVPADPELHRQIEAFAQVSGDGICFTDALTVQKNLGYYPARAVAAFLATRPGAPLTGADKPQNPDPFAPTGHDPFGAL